MYIHKVFFSNRFSDSSKIIMATFTLVFIIVTVTLKPFADYANTPITIAAFISLFVCLIPTTIGGLLSAIGIAGMDRALKQQVILMFCYLTKQEQ